MQLKFYACVLRYKRLVHKIKVESKLNQRLIGKINTTYLLFSVR